MTTWILLALAHASEPTELEVAYQREFAYLQAEKAALQAREDELAAEADRRVREAEAELGALQARLISLRGDVGAEEELLSAAIRDADGVVEARELIDATLFQAGSSLGIELPEAETAGDQARLLERAFRSGAGRIAHAGAVRVDPGSYFLPDGTKVEGDIVRVGRIAAYGVGSQSGALVPLGEGKLQLRDTQAASVAKALAKGEAPETLGLFAFEDNGKRVEEAAEKTLWSTLKAGGIVGAVILAIGSVAVVLCLLRALGLMAAGRGDAAVREALDLLDDGRWDEALKVVKAAGGAAPRVLASVLPVGPGDLRRLEDRASEAILRETPAIERYGAAILVIAAVAPLLGLLGTVTGMIGTFEVITEFGTGDPRMLSGGISEALVTTQLGLVVAIPALLVGNLLNRAAERTLSRLETAALGVINRASEPETPEEGGDAVRELRAHG